MFTGFVHIDPHEGNILLTDDGRIAFLDFGLMGFVPPHVMEGFAAGIQHTLAGDYLKLAQVFRDVEFIPKEGFQRVHGLPTNPSEYFFTPTTKEDFAIALEKQMKEEEGGNSRFGAIFTGLVKMSGDFRLSCPPYVLLFIRTFLTLEGIAAQYDPHFNIYEVGLPYAIRRALAPTTKAAQEAFRGNVLTEDNKLRLETLSSLLGDASEAPVGAFLPVVAADADATLVATTASDVVTLVPPVATPLATGEAPQFGAMGNAAAPGAAGVAGSAVGGYAEALRSLLGMPEGRALRRLLSDVDPVALARFAASPEGRPLRSRGSEALAAAVLGGAQQLLMWPLAASRRWCWAATLCTSIPAWQTDAEALRQWQQRRWRRASRVIQRRHMSRLWAQPVALLLLGYAATRTVLAAWARLSTMGLRNLFRYPWSRLACAQRQ